MHVYKYVWMDVRRYVIINFVYENDSYYILYLVHVCTQKIFIHALNEFLPCWNAHILWPLYREFSRQRIETLLEYMFSFFSSLPLMTPPTTDRTTFAELAQFQK